MNKIRLGLSATLSGAYSLQGTESLNGLILWLDYQNSHGGIFVKEQAKNFPVELIYSDDESNPVKTSEITRALIEVENVDIVLGPYSSSLSLASAKVAEECDRIMWNYGGSSDEILGNDFKNTVTFITPASHYFDPFLNFIKDTQSGNPVIAIVFAKDSGFSRQVSGGAIRLCDELGISYRTFTYNSGKGEFISIVDQIKRNFIDTVIGIGRFEDDLGLASCLKGFNACLVGAGIDEFKNKFGKVSEGFCSVSQWEPGIGFIPDFGISSHEFTKLYADNFGKPPDYTSAQSYNIGNILAHFIEFIGSVDEKKLMEKIVKSVFTTFYGDFRIDNKTNMQTGHKTLVTQWQNGKKEVIYPYEYATSAFVLP